MLARIEYFERVGSAFATARKLEARLSSPRGKGPAPARRVVELLAERLYLLDRACAGIAVGDAGDAFVSIQPTVGDAEAGAFAERLVGMYEAWGRRRGMRVERLGHGTGDGCALAVTGIAAYTILAPESGLHVHELPHRKRSFDRVGAHVIVAPWRAQEPGADIGECARQALAKQAAAGPSPPIVRRYRSEPSPLVRDSVRDWRTGRLDRVLAGDFDVIAER